MPACSCQFCRGRWWHIIRYWQSVLEYIPIVCFQLSPFSQFRYVVTFATVSIYLNLTLSPPPIWMITMTPLMYEDKNKISGKMKIKEKNVGKEDEWRNKVM